MGNVLVLHTRASSSTVSLFPSTRPTLPLPCMCGRQQMLDGKTKYLGKGYWRDVRLGEFNGREVAIKTLRETQEESKRNKERHRWEAVALDMVGDPRKITCICVCLLHTCC